MWKEFAETTKNRKPWPLILQAISYFDNAKNKYALDLGCGGGADSIALSNAGFIVDAVDSEPAISEILLKHPNISPNSIFTIIKPMEDFDFSNKHYDLIVAWNSLPFINKEDAIGMIQKIKNHLNLDGIFVFSVFGLNDGFIKNGSAFGFGKNDLLTFLEGMTLLKFEEVERDGNTASGHEKHWHTFTGIVKNS